MEDAKIQKPGIDTLLRITKVVKLVSYLRFELILISYIKECLFVCSKTLF